MSIKIYDTCVLPYLVIDLFINFSSGARVAVSTLGRPAAKSIPRLRTVTTPPALPSRLRTALAKRSLRLVPSAAGTTADLSYARSARMSICTVSRSFLLSVSLDIPLHVVDVDLRVGADEVVHSPADLRQRLRLYVN